MTDEEVELSVREHLRWDPRVDGTHVEVRVRHGTATLAGAVPTSRARAVAEEDALDVWGVIAVDNRLEVREPAGQPRTADVEIRDALQTALASNADLRGSRIDVAVADGRVTPTGSVDASRKRMAVEETAQRLRGVVGATNNITVARAATTWRSRGMTATRSRGSSR